MSTLRTNNLVKTYKSRTVVNDVSFDVNSGEVVGLLGRSEERRVGKEC